MFNLVFIVSIVCTIVQIFKEAFTKPIPAENWANKELYHEDVMKGCTDEQLIENVKNGKYKLTEKYPEQHTDPVTGQAIIENCQLYYDDIMKYDAWQVKQWARQGKYNLD
jgi:hypothetical protein